MSLNLERPKLTPKSPWRSRIVGFGEEDPTQLLANPMNWRIHTREQEAALRDVLNRVGWVDDIVVNRTTGRVIDGHLRVSAAISSGELTVPVSYVDLTEDEEKLALAVLDPSRMLAAQDDAMILELLSSITRSVSEVGLNALLASITREPPAFAPLPPPDEMELLSPLVNLVCPGCGAEFAIERSLAEEGTNG